MGTTLEEDWQAQSVDALANPGVQGQVHALVQAGESVGGPWGYAASEAVEHCDGGERGTSCWCMNAEHDLHIPSHKYGQGPAKESMEVERVSRGLRTTRHS